VNRFFSLLLLLSAAPLLPFSVTSQAQTFTVLHAFNGDGQSPYDTLLSSKGKLYGTTYGLAANSQLGTVFELGLQGNGHVLYRFNGPSGAGPQAGLVQDAEGNWYGTTTAGGTFNFGTVFKLNPAGTETVLHNFSGGADGYTPAAGVILDEAGNLYGTTVWGGDPDCNRGQGCGTAYKVDASGNHTVLYTFLGGNKDGGTPTNGNLIRDAAGNLLGTTAYNGAHGSGTIFKVHSDGTETTVYSFASGATPSSGLIADKQGNLYGETLAGGTNQLGTVFKINGQGTATVLYNFAGGSDGSGPTGGLLFDSEGNLYGTTRFGGTIGSYGYGTVFEVAKDGTETVLHQFVQNNDGLIPLGGLIMDTQGNLYGTTSAGGAYNVGTVFKITP
jgi:uncharacterized repeat protein (TIGR03803 family)